MKTLLLILTISFLAAPSLAQARLVQPAKLVIVTGAEDAGEPDAVVEKFHKLLRQELNKLRHVTICQRCDGLDVYATAQAITKDGRVVGYTAAVFVVSDSKPREKFWLTLKSGPTLETLARSVTKALNTEVFKENE